MRAVNFSLMVAALMVFGATATARPKPASAPAPVAAATAPTAPNQPVRASRAPQRATQAEVLWGGSWWPAEVVARRGALTKIHYTGWGPEWDEWVTAARLRFVKPSAVPAPRAGQPVEVEWRGSWWPAEVIEHRAGLTKIHYTGWGAEWDEWIEAPRLRTVTVVKR